MQSLQKIASKADPQRKRQVEFVQVENCANLLLERVSFWCVRVIQLLLLLLLANTTTMFCESVAV